MKEYPVDPSVPALQSTLKGLLAGRDSTVAGNSEPPRGETHQRQHNQICRLESSSFLGRDRSPKL